MKKYMFCFLLFAATSLLCLGIGFVITKDSVQPEEAIPGATLETETVTEDQIVINQEKVSPAPEKEKEKYYIGGRLSACPVSGSDDDLSVYPYAGYGFPGGGAGPSDGWHLVLLHDRGV